ncbi:MAG: hypothetical protein JO147_04605, partial [Actinobacteria bacterium]|nr:hypothetical protein [Actinomycetota bacterium]
MQSIARHRSGRLGWRRMLVIITTLLMSSQLLAGLASPWASKALADDAIANTTIKLVDATGEPLTAVQPTNGQVVPETSFNINKDQNGDCADPDNCANGASGVETWSPSAAGPSYSTFAVDGNAEYMSQAVNLYYRIGGPDSKWTVDFGVVNRGRSTFWTDYSGSVATCAIDLNGIKIAASDGSFGSMDSPYINYRCSASVTGDNHGLVAHLSVESGRLHPGTDPATGIVRHKLDASTTDVSALIAAVCSADHHDDCVVTTTPAVDQQVRKPVLSTIINCAPVADSWAGTVSQSQSATTEHTETDNWQGTVGATVSVGPVEASLVSIGRGSIANGYSFSNETTSDVWPGATSTMMEAYTNTHTSGTAVVTLGHDIWEFDNLSADLPHDGKTAEPDESYIAGGDCPGRATKTVVSAVPPLSATPSAFQVVVSPDPSDPYVVSQNKNSATADSVEGLVAFYDNGKLISACNAITLTPSSSRQAVATCNYQTPVDGGLHVIKVDYLGHVPQVSVAPVYQGKFDGGDGWEPDKNWSPSWDITTVAPGVSPGASKPIVLEASTPQGSQLLTGGCPASSCTLDTGIPTTQWTDFQSVGTLLDGTPDSQISSCMYGNSYPSKSLTYGSSTTKSGGGGIRVEGRVGGGLSDIVSAYVTGSMEYVHDSALGTSSDMTLTWSAGDGFTTDLQASQVKPDLAYSPVIISGGQVFLVRNVTSPILRPHVYFLADDVSAVKFRLVSRPTTLDDCPSSQSQVNLVSPDYQAVTVGKRYPITALVKGTDAGEAGPKAGGTVTFTDAQGNVLCASV